MILLGEGRVGKTSIQKSILDKDYILGDEISTEGIDISAWQIKNEQENININIWDFGGQEVYHSTHQFFLTKKSLYLLVTESRKEDKPEDFYYWLNMIKVFGGSSPVIIVLNKCDQPSKELPINEYKTYFPNILGYEKVSCHPDYKTTIKALKESIYRIIDNKDYFPHLNSPVPRKWIEVRSRLIELKEKGIKSIRLDDYLKLCQEIIGNDEISTCFYLSQYLHDIGVILHFQDDLVLRKVIFLDVNWVTAGIYLLLDDKKVLSKQGIFDNDDVLRILGNNGYYDFDVELIALMKKGKFDICLELENGKYLAPQLLPLERPEMEWNEDYSNKLCYYFQYEFMPRGIMSRFIVNMSKDIIDNIFWRYGVVLKYKDASALVIEDYFEKRISINVIGKENRDYLEIIKKVFYDINNNFLNIKVQELIPCVCAECTKSSSPHFYNREDLIRRKEKGKQTIECYKSYIDVDVNMLMTGSEKSNLGVEKSKIMKLIKRGELKELFDYYSSLKLPINNDLILLENRFNKNNNSYNRGILSYHDHQVETVRISDAIIDVFRDQ